MSAYKLRCSLVGHESDVRAVAAACYPDNAIVSASRDRTTRIWATNEFDRGFTESLCMSGHTNFIACICIYPPDDKYQHGLVLTGSNDKSICAFTLESPEPVYKLSGHNDTVSCLAVGKFGTILSGSWDTTAKVWLNQKCVMTLQNHTLAVWGVAIMPTQGLMLTASADKTIKMWKAGKLEKTFKGHTDCVRGLAVLTDMEFLSCANDASIRRWLVSGECVHTYYGHTNFIYSIAILPNGEDFVTASEDKTIKVWKDGDCAQTIRLPTESIWSVTCLSNGDIVAGCSDAIVRVFTKDPERMASESEQRTFEEHVASCKIDLKTDDLGEIRAEDLPGIEALQKPGKKDGDTTMVRTPNGVVEAYQWSMVEQKWIKIGDVVGSTGATQQTSGKQLHNGKQYDYVFSIDIEDGKPPLKLPYNITDDPWFAAQNFLTENNLSQIFLDQVANFIIENSKGVTFQQQAANSVVDPFTGQSRYVPGASAVPHHSAQVSGSDPFTGAGRYVPDVKTQQVTQNSAGEGVSKDVTTGSGDTPTASSLFPQKSYLGFAITNSDLVINKLKEFNSKVDAKQQVEEHKLQMDVTALLDIKHVPTADQIELFGLLLEWHDDILFPVLDLLKQALRNPVIAQQFCSDKHGVQFISQLLTLAEKSKPVANQMLVLQCVCNVFDFSKELLITIHDECIKTGMASAEQNPHHKRLVITVSTLLLNYSVLLCDYANESVRDKCLLSVGTLLQMPISQHSEAVYRCLVALGTLLSGDELLVACARSLELDQVVRKFLSVTDPAKVGECAKLIIDKFLTSSVHSVNDVG